MKRMIASCCMLLLVIIYFALPLQAFADTAKETVEVKVKRESVRSKPNSAIPMPAAGATRRIRRMQDEIF